MARRCVTCGKGVMRNLQVSHAKNRMTKTRRPNLQRAKVLVEGKPKRVWLCSKCYRKATKAGKTDFERIKKLKKVKKTKKTN